MSEIVEKFKRTLKELVEQKGIGIVGLAKELKISRFVIHKWLTQAKDMRLGSLLRLADYFECSIEYLCGKTDVYLGYEPKEIPKFSDRLRVVLAEHNTSAYRLFKDTKIMATQLHQWTYNNSQINFVFRIYILSCKKFKYFSKIVIPGLTLVPDIIPN